MAVQQLMSLVNNVFQGLDKNSLLGLAAGTAIGHRSMIALLRIFMIAPQLLITSYGELLSKFWQWLENKPQTRRSHKYHHSNTLCLKSLQKSNK